MVDDAIMMETFKIRNDPGTNDEYRKLQFTTLILNEKSQSFHFRTNDDKLKRHE